LAAVIKHLANQTRVTWSDPLSQTQ